MIESIATVGALLLAYIAAYLWGAEALALSLIISSTGVSTFYFARRFQPEKKDASLVSAAVISLFLMAGILRIGSNPLGTHALFHSPYSAKARNEAKLLIEKAEATPAPQGKKISLEIDDFMVSNSRWLSGETPLWKTPVGEDLLAEQGRNLKAYESYQAKKQEVEEKFEKAHPIGIFAHVRNDRSIRIDFVQKFERIKVKGSSMPPIEGGGNNLVAVFMTAINTGKDQGNMRWSNFYLQDIEGDEYSIIEDSQLALDEWRKANNAVDQRYTLQPGGSARLVQVFRVKKNAIVITLRANQQEFRLSNELSLD
jgi:hypothetical protein